MLSHFFTVELRSNKYGYSWLGIDDEGQHFHGNATYLYQFPSVVGALAHIKMAQKQFTGTNDYFYDAYIYLNENGNSYLIMDSNGNQVRPDPKGHINTCIDCGRREESSDYDPSYICIKCYSTEDEE